MFLNGSPHKNGDVAFLIGALKKELGGRFYQADAYFCGIRPCTGCGCCKTHNACAIQDGMQALYRQMEEADNIVICSPVYFSNLTGPLLSVLSRVQRYYMARMRGEAPLGAPKAGAVLLAGGGDGSVELALRSAKILLGQMGARFVGAAAILNTDQMAAKDDPGALEQTAALAKALRYAQEGEFGEKKQKAYENK